MLHTVAASNNRVHSTRSLSLSPLASAINCSLGSQALFEVTHGYHSIIACSHHVYIGVVCRTHSVHGEPRIQRNASGVVATVPTANKIRLKLQNKTLPIRDRVLWP